jgi:ADP-heptose:LPS heptosyltransferase
MARQALVIHTGGGLGDLLLSSPIGEALKQHFPGISVTWWVRSRHAPILDASPHVDRTWTDEAGAPFGSLLRTIRRGRYDLVLFPWTTGRQAALAWLGGIPRRIGQAGRVAYSWMFTDRVRVRSAYGDTSSHWVDIQLDYARAAGCDAGAIAPRIWLTGADREAAAHLLASRGMTSGDVLCALHVGRDLPIASLPWNVDRLVDIGRAVSSAHGVRIVLTGSDAERPVVTRVQHGIGPAALNLAGDTNDVRQLAAVIDRSALFVGLDSGPMHVAAALGVPVVGVFALASDGPARWGPYGTASRIVRTGSWHCPRRCTKETCRDFECLARIDVEGAVGAANELLPLGMARTTRSETLGVRR